MGDANKTFGWLAGADNNLVAPHMEYLRKNRWVIDFAGLPTGLTSVSAQAGLSLRLNCSKAARPKISFEEAEVKRLNGSIFLAGKPKYEALSVTFYDSVRQPDPLNSVPTASDIMEQWRELIYQPNKGDAFGSVANYKGFAYLHMLAPVTLTPTAEGADVDFTAMEIGVDGDAPIAQSWLYQGLFPQNIEYGDVDYGSNDVQEITVTFRYDRALRVKGRAAIVA
jgi:hypothetical protein